MATLYGYGELGMIVPEEATRHYRRQCEFKRLNVICDLLKEGDRVLDVGCGVGNYISNPLSWLPVEIMAIDMDAETIEYAKSRNKRKNLEFMVADGEKFKSSESYDVIVCSNILEHMAEPKVLLNNMRELLKDDGIMYLGLPNGFGVFEMQNLVPRLLYKTTWGRKLVKWLQRGEIKDTLNIESQHVQFLTVGRVKGLLAECKWRIINQINDELLGGIVFDRLLLKVPVLAGWNIVVAEFVPAQLANGWIFICKKS